MNFLDLRPGASVEGDKIPCFRSEEKADKYVYLMAGTHGDEVEGVYVLQKLFNWLQEKEDLSLPLIIIPILNVDGYRSGTRVNSHGVDLNRNLPANSWNTEFKKAKYNPGPGPSSEPENQFLIKLFDKFSPKLILSFHSWKPMLNYNGDCEEIAKLLHKFNSYPMVKEIENYPTPGSLGDFGPEKYNAPVLTFECPTLAEGVTLKGIWEENMTGLKELFASNIL
ncbi:MAG: DUF2817 domain-containing protein [Epsilonproteobacteria bacterium]|nr:MAG: DUF2817 domain-containing protein [Campylobacterota bacterium]RLA66218.1 MAG: DUF2817 domain-containing protein [Campylobacterota bacterium]